jgi:hypothetical protein
VLAATLTLLSPRAAAVGIPALLAVAAAFFGLRRAEAVRRGLRLPPPRPARHRVRLALVASVVALLALTAAQPALTHDHDQRSRRDAQALFVFDISRSMAASDSPRSPTRLDRAAAAAARLRASIPEIPSGVATLTDRVLPDLLPVPDRKGFDRVLAGGLAIESPPPQRTAVRATSYDALQQIPGAGYFDPKTRKRIVVVLTDGESAPVQTGEIADAFAAAPGFQVLFVRFGRGDEAVYDEDGRAETAYRPDPAAGAQLDTLASALDGRAYDEDELPAAARQLRQLAGTGPTTTSPGTVETLTPLAPFTAVLALLTVFALVATPLRGVRLMA